MASSRPSESSRRDAIRWLGLHPDRVRAIHHGVADEYILHIAEADAAQRVLLAARRYILFVSTIEPRKNLDRLLDAYALLSARLCARNSNSSSPARAAGRASPPWRASRCPRPAFAISAMCRKRLLPTLVAGATVFAYPSLYEGFGFPVAQAMAARVAVLTSNNSSLPEVTGDSAILLIDPLQRR